MQVSRCQNVHPGVQRPLHNEAFIDRVQQLHRLDQIYAAAAYLTKRRIGNMRKFMQPFGSISLLLAKLQILLQRQKIE